MEEKRNEDIEQLDEKIEKPEDMVAIYDKVLSPQARSSRRYEPIIEEKEFVDPETKKKVLIDVIVGYNPIKVPFRERHLIDETTSNLTRHDKNLLRIDRQLCTLFQLMKLDYGIDLNTAYDYFYENAEDELNLSKSVDGWGMMAMRTTRQYQEGRLETKQQQLDGQEKKNFWGFLRK